MFTKALSSSRSAKKLFNVTIVSLIHFAGCWIKIPMHTGKCIYLFASVKIIAWNDLFVILFKQTYCALIGYYENSEKNLDFWLSLIKFSKETTSSCDPQILQSLKKISTHPNVFYNSSFKFELHTILNHPVHSSARLRRKIKYYSRMKTHKLYVNIRQVLLNLT